MKRNLRLTNVLQGLFLTCFGAILVLWFASYSDSPHELRWRDAKGDSHWIISSRGELQYSLSGEWKDGAGPSWYPLSELQPATLIGPEPTLANKLGFGWRYTANLRGWRGGQPPSSDEYALFRTIWLPWWAIVLPFALVTLLVGARRLKRRLRTRVGHCSQCGYDLRATPDRCPECGAVPR